MTSHQWPDEATHQSHVIHDLSLSHTQSCVLSEIPCNTTCFTSFWFNQNPKLTIIFQSKLLIEPNYFIVYAQFCLWYHKPSAELGRPSQPTFHSPISIAVRDTHQFQQDHLLNHTTGFSDNHLQAGRQWVPCRARATTTTRSWQHTVSCGRQHKEAPLCLACVGGGVNDGLERRQRLWRRCNFAQYPTEEER